MPQIDVTHIRSTTKFDHLLHDLQVQIQELDTAFLNQQTDCGTVGSTLIPAVQESGAQLAPATDYLSTKVEELEEGLQNDAENIVSFRDGELKQDMGELECVFSNVDRLRVPRQYQLNANTMDSSVGGTSVLGSNTMSSTGLSGWWNQPQTLRGTRGTTGVGGQSLQLVNDEADNTNSARPKTMVDLFDRRIETFKRVNDEHVRLLSEIEDFIDGLEEKVIMREREVNERLNYGNSNAAERKEEDKQRKLNQLGFVFGEVQRGLYEMADKVGVTREGIVELGMLNR